MGVALIIEARQERGCAIVTVAGEIDIATATRLRERLFELAAGGRPLVADLDQVSFIDSAGLSALVGAAKRAAAHGGSLHVVCARPKIRQLFRLTGLDRRLMPARTLHEALDALLAAGTHPASRPRRRPGPQAPVPGGEDHEATRSGKGGSRLLARNRLPPSGVGHAMRPCGLLATLPRAPPSGPVTGQPLAHLRELLASMPASQDRGP
jgi:anti-sigma B factor antagonist